MRLQHLNGKFKIQRFGRQYIVFIPDFISAQNMVRVIEGKLR